MTPDALFTRARQVAAQRRIPIGQALAELGRRGAVKRNYGRVKPKTTTAGVEAPGYWWLDR